MRTPRAAQITQLFIFLSAVLVIGATVFLGSKLIGNLSETACKAGDVTFMREITETLDARSTYGSKDIAKVSPPCNAIALCFVDHASIGVASFNGNDTVINASVHSGVRYNIFLRSRDKTVGVGYDERIILSREPTSTTVPDVDTCIPARSGDFTFRTQGYGRYIKIASAAS